MGEASLCDGGVLLVPAGGAAQQQAASAHMPAACWAERRADKAGNHDAKKSFRSRPPWASPDLGIQLLVKQPKP